MNSDFSKNLKTLRENLNLKQDFLSQKLGISRSVLSYYESGKSEPTLSMLLKISDFFNIPIDEVTKEQRSNAKAVNFGIVYGISDFGLGEQLHISRKKAKQYIDQYLEMYSGIKKFMENIVESAKEKGYVETEFKRRRYIPELKSNNYMVRQFGQRVAMNTPIQGTAADIMKIAMINVMKELKSRKTAKGG